MQDYNKLQSWNYSDEMANRIFIATRNFPEKVDKLLRKCFNFKQGLTHKASISQITF